MTMTQRKIDIASKDDSTRDFTTEETAVRTSNEAVVEADRRDSTISEIQEQKISALCDECVANMVMADPTLAARKAAIDAHATTLSNDPTLDPETGWPE